MVVYNSEAGFLTVNDEIPALLRLFNAVIIAVEKSSICPWHFYEEFMWCNVGGQGGYNLVTAFRDKIRNTSSAVQKPVDEF